MAGSWARKATDSICHAITLPLSGRTSPRPATPDRKPPHAARTPDRADIRPARSARGLPWRLSRQRNRRHPLRRVRAGRDHPDRGRSRPSGGSGYRLLAVRMLLHQRADLARLLPRLPAAAGVLLDYSGHGARRAGAASLELRAGDRRLLRHRSVDAAARPDRLDAQVHEPFADADRDGVDEGETELE